MTKADQSALDGEYLQRMAVWLDDAVDKEGCDALYYGGMLPPLLPKDDTEKLGTDFQGVMKG